MGILVIRESILHVILAGTVMIAFKTKSLFLFFIFYEIRVLPILIIVFLFGYQPEKLQASLALVIYMVVRRLPLLLYIMSSDLSIISGFLSIPVTLSFIVKTPLYLVHT